MRHTSSVLLNRLLSRGTFRHMQVLLNLAELGSVQRTADAIGMTQSSVTQSLATIEQLLDMALFHRHPRGVRPTPACLDLLPVVHQVMSGLAGGAEAIAARHNDGQGVVRLFASASAIHGLLMPALFAFNDLHPGIVVQLQEAEREDLLLAATGRMADMAVCRRPPVVPAGWVYRPLVEDYFVAVCRPTHPLASPRRCVTNAELAQAGWLLSPAGTAARECFDTLAGHFPAPARTHALVTRSMATTSWLLGHRDLLGLLPHSFVRHLLDDGSLVALELSDNLPMDPIGVLLPEADLREAPARLAEYLFRLQSIR